MPFMVCRSCGDPVPTNPFRAPNGLPTRPKCHCETCYLELVWGVIPRNGYVHHMDTSTGGGERVLRSNKSLQ